MAAVLCVAVSLAAFSGCQVLRLLGMDDVFPEELDAVDRIIIRDGGTGDPVELVQPQEVAGFIALLRQVRLENSPDQGSRAGYAFYADFYTAGRHAARLTMWERRVALADEYYDLDSSLDLERIADFFQR